MLLAWGSGGAGRGGEVVVAVLEAPVWGEQLIHLFLRGLKVRCSGRGRSFGSAKAGLPRYRGRTEQTPAPLFSAGRPGRK